jgi:hypothetical protein
MSDLTALGRLLGQGLDIRMSRRHNRFEVSVEQPFTTDWRHSIPANLLVTCWGNTPSEALQNLENYLRTLT